MACWPESHEAEHEAPPCALVYHGSMFDAKVLLKICGYGVAVGVRVGVAVGPFVGVGVLVAAEVGLGVIDGVTDGVTVSAGTTSSNFGSET